MIRKIFFAFVCVVLTATQLHASEDRAFFWKATSQEKTVYLFGSIHFADKSFYPLRSEIEQAFESSDALVVEVKMDDITAARYSHLVQTRGSYTGNETIKDHVSAKTYQALKERLKVFRLPLEAVHKLKPGIVVLTLTGLDVMRMGLDPSLGMDLHFVTLAADKKKVLSLETVDEQLNIFLDIPDGDLFLKESLDSMDESDELLARLGGLWKSGDVDGMHELLFEEALEQYPEFGKIYDSLFYKRNQRMVKKINDFLKTDKTLFVVVGAGHLIGEQSVLSLLKKQGYVIERL